MRSLQPVNSAIGLRASSAKSGTDPALRFVPTAMEQYCAPQVQMCGQVSSRTSFLPDLRNLLSWPSSKLDQILVRACTDIVQNETAKLYWPSAKRDHVLAVSYTGTNLVHIGTPRAGGSQYWY